MYLVPRSNLRYSAEVGSYGVFIQNFKSLKQDMTDLLQLGLFYENDNVE